MSLARLLGAAVLLACAASASDAQERTEAARRAPSDGIVHLGALALDPEIRIDGDWRRSVATPGDTTLDDVGLSGKRIGVEGRLGRLGFDVSAELASRSFWRNVQADYRLPVGVTLAGGQFKVPFSLDGSSSALDRDFVFRSRLADAFTMGRDRGFTAQGNLWRKRLTIEGGVFARDGQRMASDAQVTGGAHLTRVARLVAAPLSRGPRAFKSLRIGASAASSRLDEGRSGLTLRTVSGLELTSPAYWVQGARRRTGLDARWQPGALSITAEIATLADERHGQGVGDDDLAPLRGSGWYLEGTWFLTGEAKGKRTRPRRPLTQGGMGAIELVGRAEHASIGDHGPASEAFSPRAPHPAWSEVRALTTGLNWYPTAGTRLQFNVTHEAVSEATTSALRGVSTIVTSALRFQIFR